MISQTSVYRSLYHPKFNQSTLQLMKDVGQQYAEKMYLTKWYGDFTVTNRGGTIQEEDADYATWSVAPGASQLGCDRRQFNIDYLGNVHPCCHAFDGSYALGNIRESTLINIYERNEEQLQQHFLVNFTKPVCLKCVGLDPT